MQLVKRIIGRILKIGSVAILSTIVTALVLISIAWFFPGLWFTEATLRFASRFAPDLGVNVTWKNGAEVSLQTTSLFGKRLRLVADRVCVGVTSANLDACVDHLDIDLGLLFRFGFSIRSVDRLIIKGARVAITEIKSESPTPQAPSSANSGGSPLELPVGLGTANFGEILVELKKFKYRSTSDSISGAGHIKLSQLAEADKGLSWAIGGDATYQAAGERGENFKFELKAMQATRNITTLNFIDLLGDYRGSFYFPAHLKANLSKSNLHLEVGVNRKHPPVIVGDVDLSKNKEGIFSHNLQAKGKFIVSQFERLVEVLHKSPFAIPSPLNVLRGPVELVAEYSTNDKENRTSIPMQLAMNLGSDTQRLAIVTKGDLELSSENGIGKTKLRVDALINKARLVLPPLNIEKLPPIFPDGRIHTKLTREDQRSLSSETASNFEYRITVKSEKPDSILIVTNAAKDAIPLEIDIGFVSGKPISGSIHLGHAELDVLRRNAALKKAKIEFPGTETPPRISAELSVKYSEYTVFVHVFGNTDKPDFFLTSTPPLSDEDALSVLLFGQTSSDLDSGQTDTVADTRAAVANRAVSLASMYLLTTTPIESVGYDPISNTVSARVRLRDGTTLQMKSSGRGLAGVGLRQSLGGPWSIRTEIENMSGSEEERSASAVLEWSKRY